MSKEKRFVVQVVLESPGLTNFRNCEPSEIDILLWYVAHRAKHDTTAIEMRPLWIEVNNDD